MSFKIVKGDLLQMAEEGHFNYIVHGCNCFCTMGAGIAAQIANKYPVVANLDSNSTIGDSRKLGRYSKAFVKDKHNKAFNVINAYTQYRPGGEFKLYFLQTFLTIFAIEEGITNNTSNNKRVVGFPKIGCGIGKGNWDEVKELLEAWSNVHCVDVVVVVYPAKKEGLTFTPYWGQSEID